MFLNSHECWVYCSEFLHMKHLRHRSNLLQLGCNIIHISWWLDTNSVKLLYNFLNDDYQIVGSLTSGRYDREWRTSRRQHQDLKQMSHLHAIQFRTHSKTMLEGCLIQHYVLWYILDKNELTMIVLHVMNILRFQTTIFLNLNLTEEFTPK